MTPSSSMGTNRHNYLHPKKTLRDRTQPINQPTRHLHVYKTCSLFLPPYVRSSNNDDDIDTSIHSHTAPPSFLMSPNDSKLFSQPGFGFSMAALGADPGSLVGECDNAFYLILIDV